MGTNNSLQYLIWLKSKTVKIYSVVQSVKLLLALSIVLENNGVQNSPGGSIASPRTNLSPPSRWKLEHKVLNYRTRIPQNIGNNNK